MRLTILGTAGPVPDPKRAQSGFLLERGGRPLLLDCGSGVYQRLCELGVDWGRLDTVLLTHHHLDHMIDLLSVVTGRWLLGHPHTSVYGPAGTRDLVAKLVALFPYVEGSVSVSAHDLAAGAATEVTGFRVETLALRHFQLPSLAYKFDGRLAVCGDSEPVPSLKAFASGCEALVHECSYTDAHPDGAGHATPGGLGRALAGAELGALWLTHFYPEAAAAGAALLRGVRAHFDGAVRLAHDGTRIVLEEG